MMSMFAKILLTYSKRIVQQKKLQPEFSFIAKIWTGTNYNFLPYFLPIATWACENGFNVQWRIVLKKKTMSRGNKSSNWTNRNEIQYLNIKCTGSEKMQFGTYTGKLRMLSKRFYFFFAVISMSKYIRASWDIEFLVDLILL